MSKFAITATMPGRAFTVRGQEAKALDALVKAGPKGVTALECGAWAFRLAAYCHALKHDHGLNIVTERERHPGGWHGRHVLLDQVTIIDQSDREPVKGAA